MSERPQSFENHAKMVPLYHYVGSPLFLVAFLTFGYLTVTDFTLERLALMAVLVYLGIVGLYARLFALGVQDRVIRLEERLRLQRLLPEELRPRVGELHTRQLIALRFASDGEVAELAARVLSGELTEPKEIKRAVRSWRADHQRV
jgi:small-conductance mechanosensitive channel